MLIFWMFIAVVITLAAIGWAVAWLFGVSGLLGAGVMVGLVFGFCAFVMLDG